MDGGWTHARLADIDPIAVVDGSLQWRPVRRTLGVQAFGINAYVAPDAGVAVVEKHTEATLGHEEVYLVLAGRAIFTIGADTLDATAGTLVFIRDPAIERGAVAAEADTTVLAIGGKAGEPYTPSAWEAYFHAERHRPTGDFDAMAEELVDALAQYPENASILYNAACAEAQAGRLDDARAHLARALELRPELEPWSREDADLAALRARDA